MRHVAGEKIEAGEMVRIDADGTVRRLRGRDTGYDVVLEGGPADGTTLTFGFGGATDTVQIQGSWAPSDALNGEMDEYVRTDARDDAGRTIYVHRRQRYTAEGGTWRPA